VGREVNTWLRRAAANWSRTVCALVDLLKFFVGLVGAVAVAGLLSWLMTSLGWDPRGSFLGTYDQRNALIVGFVMGFAIIPLIYTVAEDALSTVPEHLRSASLGAGATPWQTAVRIVIPTAMSGLFSALMIGLGRAVGETMIVLMAAGNTPVRQWNIFNGFRTLSANIAVELPEAPVDSTHYRTLFLAALCLFVLTFAVNTVAELVRLRFRRRAYEL
jgi:phosphate transport system permease protein